MSRVHAHLVVFTCRPGQDSGETTIQLARESIQAWEIPPVFDELDGRSVKLYSYIARRFTEYPNFDIIRRYVSMQWMRHRQDNHAGHVNVHFAWYLVHRLPKESCILDHMPSVNLNVTNISDIEQRQSRTAHV